MSKRLDSLDQCQIQRLRQDSAYVGIRISTLHLRLHLISGGLFLVLFPGSEVAKCLYRNPSGCAAICRFFQIPLETHPVQRILCLIILRRDSHNDRAVCITASAAAVAHTVYRQSSRLRRSIDDVPSRTHTKRIHTTAIRTFMRHLVRGRSKLFADRHAVHSLIDPLLRMLHTEPDRECLWLHRHAKCLQHFKRIPCTVADRQHQMIRLHLLPAIDLQLIARTRFLCTDSGQAALEPESAAQSFDLLPDMSHDRYEHVGPDVRFIII